MSRVNISVSVGRSEIPVLLKRPWSWSLILKLRVVRLKLEGWTYWNVFPKHVGDVVVVFFFLGQSWLKFRYEECILSIVSNILWAKALSNSATPRRHEKLYQWSSACVCCPDRKTGCLTDKMWLDRNKHMSVHKATNSMLFKPGIPKKYSDKEKMCLVNHNPFYYELYQHILFMSGIQYTIPQQLHYKLSTHSSTRKEIMDL